MSGSRAPASEHRVMGLLFVDKPAGISSHDVVGTVRRAARTRRIGHAGTLDPFATGLLVVAVGSCTRLLPYLAGEPKVYEATFRFGAETDTDDGTGSVIRAASPPAREHVVEALSLFTGTFAQVPPAFSAKHVDGQRAYAVARRGGTVSIPPACVTVHRWEVLTQADECIHVRITCAGGTYVRALARDLGRAVHSAAYCARLRRVASGAATVENAVTLDDLSPGAVSEGQIPVVSPLAFLAPMAHEHLNAEAMVALSHGRTVPATQRGDRAALLHDGNIVGIADRAEVANIGVCWQPRVVLLDGVV